MKVEDFSECRKALSRGLLGRLLRRICMFYRSKEGKAGKGVGKLTSGGSELLLQYILYLLGFDQ